VHLTESSEHRRFREEARAWLREHVPDEPRPPQEDDNTRAFDMAWQRTQYEGGWAGISWPREYGGRGLSLFEQVIWYEEYVDAGAPEEGSSFVGLNHAGPTLITRGTEEQKAEHLLPVLRGDVLWCQGFSEPDAGSDLAGISTRAVVDGTDLVVSGSKIWTSYAHLADLQELLVRTGRGERRGDGLTWVICDMRVPGIEVQPIPTMLGVNHFCQVFYDDARIPLSNVVGSVDEGWSVAMSTMSFERGTAFIAHQAALAREVEHLVALAQEHPGPDGIRRAVDDDEIARDLGMLRVDVAALRALTLQEISRVARSGVPGAGASFVRLAYTELWQRIFDVAMKVLGPDALHCERDDPEGRWPWGHLNSLRGTIASGTKDIQRNIIGERILGLPRDRA
jgi:alkylation response protein AidB-like acyl-CoA dehydrogenase